MAGRKSEVEVVMIAGILRGTGGERKWSMSTEWNGQELTAQSQRKEEPRTREQTNAIVVNAQWPLKVTAESLNKESIAIHSHQPN